LNLLKGRRKNLPLLYNLPLFYYIIHMEEVKITGLDSVTKKIKTAISKEMSIIANDFYRNVRLLSPLGVGDLQKSWKIDRSDDNIEVWNDLPYAVKQNREMLYHPRTPGESFTQFSNTRASTQRSYRQGYYRARRDGLGTNYKYEYIEKALKESGIEDFRLDYSGKDMNVIGNIDAKIQKAIDKIEV